MGKSPLKDSRGFLKRNRNEVPRRRKKEKTRSQKQKKLKRSSQKNRKPRKKIIPRTVRTNPREATTGLTKHVISSLSQEVIPDLRGGSRHWQRLQVFITP
jgi:hypothetical protein